MKNKCNCDLCKRNKKFNKILEDIQSDFTGICLSYFCSGKEKQTRNNILKKIKRKIKWLEDLYSHLMNIEKSHDLLKRKYDALSEKTGYEVYLDGTVEKISKDKILIDENLTDPDAWICIVGSQEDNAKSNNS